MVQTDLCLHATQNLVPAERQALLGPRAAKQASDSVCVHALGGSPLMSYSLQ